MQFKARMEKPIEGFHAIEVWFEADNIIDAGRVVMDKFGALGIEPGSVTVLVEQKPAAPAVPPNQWGVR
jgi:hypothetical protein